MNLFMENLDLPSELDKLEFLHNKLAEKTDIINSLDSWYLDFKTYMNDHFYAGNCFSILNAVLTATINLTSDDSLSTSKLTINM